jgi:membrane protease YdiL (CAAX protease family)
MDRKLETKRIWIFIGFTFGIAWAFDLAVYFAGGVTDLRIASLPGILMIGSMAAPAAAHILTRLVTGEGWKNVYLRPQFKMGWCFWAIAWLGTPLLILLGTGLFFVVFPQYLDSTLLTARQMLDQITTSTGRPVPFGPAVLLVLQVIQGIVLGPLTNGWATLGEEFGWRAYLLHKLMPLGGRRAVLLLGVIWGVWHWPVIAMGYNYGIDYAGAPWLGLLAMTWFTVVLGTYLAWMTLKSRSVWPAVIGHASINCLGTIGTLVSKGQPNSLLGPTMAGLVASLPLVLLALWLLWRSPELGKRRVSDRQPKTTPLPARHVA